MAAPGPPAPEPGFRPPATGQPVRRLPDFLAVAAALLLFCAGGAMGWFAHGVVRPGPGARQDAVIADINRAYAFYGARGYPVPFPAERAEEFVTWIGRSFAREVRPPNLAEFGYHYRGGRVLPSAGGNVGIFQYERQDNAELAVFFWTTSAPPRLDLDNLGARLWSIDGVSFAYGDAPVLRDVSVRVPAGRVIGVVGRTGSHGRWPRLLFRLSDVSRVQSALRLARAVHQSDGRPARVHAGVRLLGRRARRSCLVRRIPVMVAEAPATDAGVLRPLARHRISIHVLLLPRRLLQSVRAHAALVRRTRASAALPR